MKKTLCLFALFFIIITAASVRAQVLDAPMWDESTELNPNDLKTYRDMVWETWKDDMMADETLLMETSELTLEFGDVQMYYFIYAADGDKPENGYPLYIALHGIKMPKVLLVLCHPNYKNSFANKIVVDKLKTLIPDMEIDNIHELYPDGKIDVKAEQEKCLKADTIIFQYPVFWFSCPYLLSKWIEEVFAHGFAYGTDKYKLEGKKLILSFTLGGALGDYKGKFDLERLIGHFEATGLFVKMKFGGYAYTADIVFDIKSKPDLCKTKTAELEKQAEKVCELAHK